jgi:hypothetical protein
MVYAYDPIHRHRLLIILPGNRQRIRPEEENTRKIIVKREEKPPALYPVL